MHKLYVKCLSLIVWGIFLVKAAQAQTILSSLESTWEIALKNNPDQQTYLLNIQKAEQELKIAKSYKYFNADLSFNAQNNLKIASTPVPGALVQQPNEQTVLVQFGRQFVYNTGINLSRSLYNRQQRLSELLSKENIALKTLEKEVFEQVLKEQIAQLYYTCILSRELITISQKNLALADTLFINADSRFQKGLSDKLELNQTQIKQNQVRQKLLQNQELYTQNTEDLKLLLGLGIEDSLQITETLPKTISEEIPSLSAESDKSLQVLAKQIEMTDLEIKSSKAASYPTLGLYSYIGTQQFRDVFGLSLSSDDWNGNQYMGINLNIPLFSGFARKSQFKISQLNQQLTKTESQNTRREIENENLDLINHFNFSRQSAQRAGENYRLFAESLQLSYQRYGRGLTALDTYLKTLEDYLNAEDTYFSQLAETLRSQAKIRSKTE
ncbi:MAG: TolC family protein [Microscillaceae bacterium]|nr:TolC family protein [Microscillaceae bacterium]